MQYLRNGFFTIGDFIINGEKRLDTNKLFGDSRVLAEFREKMIGRYDDRPNIYYTCDFFRYFKNFRKVNRAEHGRAADAFNNILE